jgi:hypothetical protein
MQFDLAGPILELDRTLPIGDARLEESDRQHVAHFEGGCDLPFQNALLQVYRIGCQEVNDHNKTFHIVKTGRVSDTFSGKARESA